MCAAFKGFAWEIPEGFSFLPTFDFLWEICPSLAPLASLHLTAQKDLDTAGVAEARAEAVRGWKLMPAWVGWLGKLRLMLSSYSYPLQLAMP